MSRDTGPRRGYGDIIGWEQQSIDYVQGGSWAGAARGMESSCGGNLGLIPQLEVGTVSEMEAIG